MYSLDIVLRDILNRSMIEHAVEGLQFVKRILNELGEEMCDNARELLPVAEDYFSKLEED